MEGSLSSPRTDYYYQEIGPYRIERHCYDNNPCRHYVLDSDNGLCKLMSGKEIYNILTEYNINIPHFNYLEGRVWNFCGLTFYKSK